MYLNTVQTYIFSVILLLVVAFAACEKTEESKKIVPFNQEVSLAANEHVWFGSDTISGLKVMVDDINDSRCPSDVNCVWAGEARVSLLVNPKTDSVYVALKISPTNNSVADTVGFTIQNKNYKAALKAVMPYPLANQTTTTKTATFTIFKP